MSKSEFLEEGYSRALEWAFSLGLGDWVVSSPITKNYDLVTLHGTEDYFRAARKKYCVLSLLARENPTFGEQSFGIQVISPLSQKEIDSRNMGRNSATIQWNNFMEDDGREVVTVDLENGDDEDLRRHVGLYYDGPKVSIMSPDSKSTILLSATNTIYYPTNLARRLLSNSISTDNFDEMLSMLIS